MIRLAAFAIALCAAQTAMAGDPATSLRPMPRGGKPAQLSVTLAPAGAITQPEQSTAQENAKKRGGLFSSLRPLFRTKKVAREGRVQKELLRKGAVCGDPAIQGEVVGRVTGKIRGCVIENAIRVRSVSGVALSQKSVMDCRTADALKTWLDGSAKPALAKSGGGLKSLRVAAHYACRTRNNQKGAKLSEHGKGRAIDISAFRLHDGTDVTVLKHWNTQRFASAMRRMHKGACGPFGTVLGPNANRYHLDHFHFDTARYRSGSYCK
ncbi:Extensin-like protein [Sulfitobacter noctilucae]|uniref:extensin-like domain-containing protein n=1 Tax=Sulfitobacter noctilucae TaxID=1342302 RepID=UPI00046A66B9|nr:extensin family protein [Sulfitobacter noctilucae]KIN70754.1 Extensin-like protein [Sulfitobacter noctilucae]